MREFASNPSWRTLASALAMLLSIRAGRPGRRWRAPDEALFSNRPARRIAAVAVGSLCLAPPSALATNTIDVFAASSLVRVFEDAVARYAIVRPEVSVRLHVAGSSTLVEQIGAGAVCDVLVSADARLFERVSYDGETVVLGRNRLVLFGRRGGAAVHSLDDLRNTERVVVGNPKTAPVGSYAAQVFERAGIATLVAAHLLQVESARHVVATVAAGGGAVGIGYASDVGADPRLETFVTIADSLHDPIEYHAVVPAASRCPQQARDFVTFLAGAEMQPIWSQLGVATPQPPTLPRSAATVTGPLWLSLRVAVVATLLAGVCGLALAAFLARGSGARRHIVAALVDLPLVLPPTIVGLALLTLLGPASPIGGWLETRLGLQIVFTAAAAVLASAVMALPLMVRTARAALESVPARYAQAARAHGASEWLVFWTVRMPLARRGIIAAVLLCFFRALGEFGATLLVAGNIPGHTRTLPLAIYSAVFEGDPQRAWGPVTVVVVLSFLGAWSAQRLTREAA